MIRIGKLNVSASSGTISQFEILKWGRIGFPIDLKTTLIFLVGKRWHFFHARATSGCLIGRLARFGPAFRAAAKRREWVRRESERMEEEREAHWRAYVVGRGVMRRQFAV